MSKVVASAIAGALSLTSAGGLTMVQALDRDTVTFSVDGVSQQAKVKPGTVKQALAQRGITVGPHDDVQPSLDSEIHDGQVITVNYGRRVVVTIDGKMAMAVLGSSGLIMHTGSDICRTMEWVFLKRASRL